MQFTTELAGADTILVTTRDPEVIEQLAADPDAERLGDHDGVVRFELSKTGFDLRFPAA